MVKCSCPLFIKNERSYSMKKSLAVVAIVSLLIGIICGGSMFGMAADRIFGDIDGDGKITAGDARLILRHVAKIETLKEPGKNPTTSGKVIFDSNSVKITYKSKTKDDFWDAQKINIRNEK
jgi:hypothetical protein